MHVCGREEKGVKPERQQKRRKEKPPTTKASISAAGPSKQGKLQAVK